MPDKGSGCGCCGRVQCPEKPLLYASNWNVTSGTLTEGASYDPPNLTLDGTITPKQVINREAWDLSFNMTGSVTVSIVDTDIVIDAVNGTLDVGPLNSTFHGKGASSQGQLPLSSRWQTQVLISVRPDHIAVLVSNQIYYFDLYDSEPNVDTFDANDGPVGKVMTVDVADTSEGQFSITGDAIIRGAQLFSAEVGFAGYYEDYTCVSVPQFPVHWNVYESFINGSATKANYELTYGFLAPGGFNTGYEINTQYAISTGVTALGGGMDSPTYDDSVSESDGEVSPGEWEYGRLTCQFDVDSLYITNPTYNRPNETRNDIFNSTTRNCVDPTRGWDQPFPGATTAYSKAGSVDDGQSGDLIRIDFSGPGGEAYYYLYGAWQRCIWMHVTHIYEVYDDPERTNLVSSSITEDDCQNAIADPYLLEVRGEYFYPDPTSSVPYPKPKFRTTITDTENFGSPPNESVVDHEVNDVRNGFVVDNGNMQWYV